MESTFEVTHQKKSFLCFAKYCSDNDGKVIYTAIDCPLKQFSKQQQQTQIETLTSQALGSTLGLDTEGGSISS